MYIYTYDDYIYIHTYRYGDVDHKNEEDANTANCNHGSGKTKLTAPHVPCASDCIHVFLDIVD
jgi:hypothetical protein